MPSRSKSKNNLDTYKREEHISLTIRVPASEFELLKKASTITKREPGDLGGAFFSNWVVPKLVRMIKQSDESNASAPDTDDAPMAEVKQVVTPVEVPKAPARTETNTNPTAVAVAARMDDQPSTGWQSVMPSTVAAPRLPSTQTQSQPPLRPTVPPTSPTTNPENS